MSKPLLTDPRHALQRDLARLSALLLPAFLALLNARPLSVPDEGRYPEVAREMLLSGDFITPRINGIVFLDKPALYYWLEALSLHLFGVHAWSVRLIPALFGAAGVLLVFVTAWNLFSRRAAWWSAIVLATSPLYFLASQYADMNIEIAVLVSAALCLFLLARQAPANTRRQRLLFVSAWLAMGLGVLTKGLIGIVLPALIVGVWVALGRRWRELRHWHWLGGLAIVLSVCLPWYLAVQRQNPQFFHYFFIYQQFERFAGSGFNNEWPLWFYLPVVGLGLLPWSAWLPAMLGDQYRRAFKKTSAAPFDQVSGAVDARQLLLLWPLLILVFFSIPASKIAGYIVPVLPPLALLLGDYLARRFPHVGSIDIFSARSSLQPIHAMPALGIVLIAAVIAGAAYFDRSGIRPLAAALQTQLQPSDLIVEYRNYYQDLPMYLQSPAALTVVDDWNNPNILQTDNWRREFYLGLRNQPEARSWLIDESKFASLLADRRRVFVLARARDENYLRHQYGLKVIAREKNQVLMSRTTAGATRGNSVVGR